MAKTRRRSSGKLKKGSKKGRYVMRGKGSSRRRSYVGPKGKRSRSSCSPQSRVVHVGPQGGRYCIKNGRKQYLVRGRA